MPFIRVIEEQEASGALRRVYDAAIARAGYVAGILKTMSLDAEVMQASIQFYVKLMKSPNALPAAEREMLAAVVSNVNDCYY